MHLSELKGDKVVAKLWTPIHEVESSALTQLRMVASLPWVAHLSVMPDVHYGKGATVGSVIAMRGAIAPAAVGVDIGCGMGAVRTNLKASDLPADLKPIRLAIEEQIPVSHNSHERLINLKGSREALSLSHDIDTLFEDFKNIDEKVLKRHPDLEAKAARQLGTLGGGNHFIELCLDKGEQCSKCEGYGYIEDRNVAGSYEGACDACDGEGVTEPSVWLMLHSGSRNVGKTLAEEHMWKAKGLEHNQFLHSRGADAVELAVFLQGTPEMQAYRHDLYWAQKYAMLNRRAMFEIYKSIIRSFFPHVEFEAPILAHHNYVAEEQHFGEELVVTRKGAISAKKGEMGIIPGSMGARSFIVRGLGNPDGLMSASHGAGRKMSRGKAKKVFTEADIAVQTAGVECKKDSTVLDEIPGAYKDIEQVMRNQSDLVEIVAELKQVLCVKG